ncbi:hypothetical protein [Roseomonas sp. AR75]|uniref:hypothetical protein n=1 Tax=Roseomonas sp. AR75 TaxID=2562311 RepID=UPI0010C02C15|nr:hypothetical protein [Roseomonas sp. AR75]
MRQAVHQKPRTPASPVRQGEPASLAQPAPAVQLLSEAMPPREPGYFDWRLAPAPPPSGLPQPLRGGIERLSGLSAAGIAVHRDSPQPGMLGALAFARGAEIHLGPGQEAHLPHEAWHAMQQRQGRVSPTGQRGGVAVNQDPALESEATRMGSAAQAGVTALPPAQPRATGSGAPRSGAPSGVAQMQVPPPAGPYTGYAPFPPPGPAPAPPVATTRGPDQRAGIGGGPAASVPGSDLAREIGFELDPSSRPAPVAPPAPAAPGGPGPAPAPTPARTPWDGVPRLPLMPLILHAMAMRAAMKAELFAAYDAYLTFKLPTVTAALARPRVDFIAPAAAPGAAGPAPTGVVDIANAARGELERRYGSRMDAAASSPAQVANRAPRVASGAGQNIFDISSEADRSTMTGSADLAPGVAWWLFENDVPGAAGAAGSRRFATDILAAHNYSSADDPGGAFRWEVANEYAAASTVGRPDNRRMLIDYRMADWSERGTGGITLQSRFDPGADRNRAELQQRWSTFKTATHETLHLQTHPAFTAADQGRGTMKEGFTEMFTVSTLNTDVMPKLRAGTAEPLRRTVEGALSPATPDATLLTDRASPTQYVAHRAQAERIRDGGTPPGGTAHAGVGEAAVRAAFFQGHVEMIGLDPAGAQLTGLPASGAARALRIPSGITGLDDLATRSGVARAAIEAANPGITDTLPATAFLPGARDHWVIAGETRAGIAAQNGVSEAALVRANPDIAVNAATNAWPTLTAGHRLLIPR